MPEIAQITCMGTFPPDADKNHFAELARSTGVRELCLQYGIRRLRVFGSRMGGSLRPDSDLDLIAEFYPGRTPGFAFARLAEQLSQLFGVRVDLHTPNSLSRYFRNEVLREAQEIYAAKE